MKYIFTILLLLTILSTYSAQQYKFIPQSNNLKFENINSLTVEGYSGKEVIIYLDGDDDDSDDYDDDDDDDGRSAGLNRIMSHQGKNNNTTKLGLAIENTNSIVIFSQVNQSLFCGGDNEYTVKIPITSNLRIEHSAWDGDDLSIDNVRGELEISTNFNDIYLENVTGPMSVKTVYGSIEAEFVKVSQAGAISLYSVYEHVDVTMPENLNTNVNLQTNLGNIYSDIDLTIDPTKSGKKGWTGSKIIGTANGGGVDLIITSLHENIYLRSK